jgi:hypothetical protein
VVRAAFQGALKIKAGLCRLEIVPTLPYAAEYEKTPDPLPTPFLFPEHFSVMGFQMMKVCIRDSFDPLIPSDLAEFESEVGAKLPDDYRAFLLKFNGGYFEDKVRYPYLEPCPYGEFGIIECFHGLNTGYDYADIRDDIKVLEDWNVPRNLLPIGDDIFGDPICLSITGVNRGRVFFWHREDEARVLIGNTFSQFLENIEPDPLFLEDPSEKTELLQAVEFGRLDKLKRFVAEGAAKDSRNEKGQTLLMVAARNKRLDVVKWLLSNGAKIDFKDDDGKQAIFHALGSEDCVKLLLRHGADVNSKDKEGATVLMEAFKCHNSRAAEILIGHGADVCARSESGKTVWSYYEQDVLPNRRIGELLRAKGATGV